MAIPSVELWLKEFAAVRQFWICDFGFWIGPRLSGRME
jgi:hypothetical protein